MKSIVEKYGGRYLRTLDDLTVIAKHVAAGHELSLIHI